jgi:hypothetical protein
MPTWIIDDGPFDQLALTINASELETWPADQFFVAGATAKAASGRRKDLLVSTPTPFAPFELPLGSKGCDILYKHLRPTASSSANLAEHESIAWALTERRDAIFVAVDKRAALLALAELGCGRVAHAFDLYYYLRKSSRGAQNISAVVLRGSFGCGGAALWIHLKEQGLVSQAQFETLCQATYKNDQSLPGVPQRCQDA